MMKGDVQLDGQFLIEAGIHHDMVHHDLVHHDHCVQVWGPGICGGLATSQYRKI